MKKFFIIMILPLFLLLLSACTPDAVKLYEHGKYELVIKVTEEKTNLNASQWLARARSFVALERKEEAQNSILMYLLTTTEQNNSQDRRFAVELFLEGDFTNELTILCLVPDDGIAAQIELYKAYSKINDYRNARQLLDKYLASELTYNQMSTLLINYPVECTYITGIFENWYSNLTNKDKESFINQLYKYSIQEYMTEQSARSVIYLSQCLEDDNFYSKNNLLLSLVYKTRASALEKVHDMANSSAYYRKAYSLNPDDPDIQNKLGINKK